MAKPVRTPFQPTQGPLCEGLVIQVGTPETGPRQALEMARRVVRETLPGRWEVRPLNFATRDFEIKSRTARTLNVARAWELTRRLRKHRDVASAEPALVVPGIAPDPRQVFTEEELREMPSLPGGGNLPCSEEFEWSLSLSSVRDAWTLPLPDHGFGRPMGEGIIIGHPDTGYTEHPEIMDPSRLLVASGFDFEDSDIDPLDLLVGMNPGHGTGTASVIMSAAGSQLASEFVTGVAPHAQLVPLRVSTSVIHLSFAKLTKAITYAADQDHHVISMSLGGPIGSDALLRTIRYAIERGVILLGAAGNIWPWVVYPAQYDEVIAVAACNCERAIWSGSSAGPAVDVTAAGESVWSAFAEESTAPFFVARSSGTSYAVAITAGVCALWLAYHGRDQLIQRYGASNLASVFKEILVTAGVDTPAGWDRQKYGAGILDASQVLEAPLPDTAPAGGLAAIHAGPVPRASNDLDVILTHFPALDPAAVRRVLVELLRTDEANLGLVLAELGDELRFHLAVNPELRATVARLSRGELARVAAGRRVLAENARFIRNASHRLQQRLL